jgi:uncharacterized membrane protein
MPKKKEVKKNSERKKQVHPILKFKRTLAQRAADSLTAGMGSWTFIIFFMLLLLFWIAVNSVWLIFGLVWDPKPFIMLNLILSMLAALQAPVILMSQNRQSERDRIRAEYDYSVNRKAEREIREMRILIEKLHRKRN